MLDALRNAGPARTPPDVYDVAVALEGPRPAARPLPAPEQADESDGFDEEDGGGEVPFIEVGPGRSVEGSPDVLAAVPSGPPRDPKAPAAAAPSTAPAAPGVVFRPLGAAAPSSTADFPPELVAYHDPDHPVSAQYRDLLAAVTASPGVRSPALLLCAATQDAPTAAVLLNLAITAARQGWRTAVVDADLPCSAVAGLLGVRALPGLCEVLAGAVTAEEALQPTRQPHLAALAAGGPPPAGAARLTPQGVRSLLRHLRQRFDLVLVGGPRWDGGPDAAALASACDAACLVVAGPAAGSPEVERLLRELPAKGVRLAGCVVAG
jgi:Mrp family chromosome partitioning ATPase